MDSSVQLLTAVLPVLKGLQLEHPTVRSGSSSALKCRAVRRAGPGTHGPGRTERRGMIDLAAIPSLHHVDVPVAPEL